MSPAVYPVADLRENVISRESQDGGSRLLQEFSEYLHRVTSLERLYANGNAESERVARLIGRGGQYLPRNGRPTRRVLIATLWYTYPHGGEPLGCKYSAVLEDGHQLDITAEEEQLAPRELSQDELPVIVKTPQGRLNTKTLHWLSPREVWMMRKEVMPPCWPMVCAVGAPLFFHASEGLGIPFVNSHVLAQRQKENRHECI